MICIGLRFVRSQVESLSNIPFLYARRVGTLIIAQACASLLSFKDEAVLGRTAATLRVQQARGIYL